MDTQRSRFLWRLALSVLSQVLLLLAYLAPPVAAASIDEAWLAAGLSVSANLRTGPGETYPIHGVLDQNELVFVEHEGGQPLIRNGYTHVHTSVGEGWVWADFVRLGDLHVNEYDMATRAKLLFSPDGLTDPSESSVMLRLRVTLDSAGWLLPACCITVPELPLVLTHKDTNVDTVEDTSPGVDAETPVLPPFEGRSKEEITRILSELGFENSWPNRTPAQSDIWYHSKSGLRVRIDEYGNTEEKGNAGDNPHVHKERIPDGLSNPREIKSLLPLETYDDNNNVAPRFSENTHIPIQAPADFEQVRGRPLTSSND